MKSSITVHYTALHYYTFTHASFLFSLLLVNILCRLPYSFFRHLLEEIRIVFFIFTLSEQKVLHAFRIWQLTIENDRLELRYDYYDTCSQYIGTPRLYSTNNQSKYCCLLPYSSGWGLEPLLVAVLILLFANEIEYSNQCQNSF